MSLKARLMPLLGGNIVAQLLQIGLIPVLTRLYGPERYGEYGLFAAALLFSGMLATLRYELAIQLPKKDGVARCLAGLSAVLAVLVAVFIFFVSLVFLPYLNPAVDSVIFSSFLAGSTLLIGFYNAFAALSLRSGLYKLNGYARIIQVGVGSGAALVFYWAGFEAFGLLCANMLGYLFAGLLLAVYLKDFFGFDNAKPNAWRSFVIVARRYSSFAVFNAPQALMDGLRPIAVVSFVQTAFGSSAAGLYHIANQLLQTPASVLSQAFSQVHFRLLVENMGSASIRTIVYRSLSILMVMAASGAAAVWFFSDSIVSLLFGSRWTGLGAVLDVMVGLVAVNLITAPLIYVFHVLRRHREFLLWGALYNTVAIGSIGAACIFLADEKAALSVYAACSTAVLAVLAARSVRLTLAGVSGKRPTIQK